ncbi:hypothetical protein COU57_04530 [Candidatus Pacearchaeota archaeon CG10_big_fil_rev_8_21_14_0_10_32_14]|nr:MAG: hypothetical protein COU57_04530 [Candidatus Pacearchaeota archaeon CG10_big_fil_rev_8_21_14_0_10_32_14]
MEGSEPLETLVETDEMNSKDVDGAFGLRSLENLDKETAFEVVAKVVTKNLPMPPILGEVGEKIYMIKDETYSVGQLIEKLNFGLKNGLPLKHRGYIQAARDALGRGEILRKFQIKKLEEIFYNEGRKSESLENTNVRCENILIEESVPSPSTIKEVVQVSGVSYAQPRKGFSLKGHSTHEEEKAKKVYEMLVNPDHKAQIDTCAKNLTRFMLYKSFNGPPITPEDIWKAKSEIPNDNIHGYFRKQREDLRKILRDPVDYSHYDDASRQLELYFSCISQDDHILDKENPFHAIPRMKAI